MSFYYFRDGDEIPVGCGRIFWVPVGIESKLELLGYFSEKNFPNYFGNNWDAFEECLNDLSWIDEKRVMIVHKDIPLINNPTDLRIYLDILGKSSLMWKPVASTVNPLTFMPHELQVFFPSELRETIIKNHL